MEICNPSPSECCCRTASEKHEKKNITLNGKKMEGKEKLVSGDRIDIWFSDDTISKFQEEMKPKGKDLSFSHPPSSMKMRTCWY